MLTEAEAEPKGFEDQEHMRQHVLGYAKADARRNVIRSLTSNSLIAPRKNDLSAYWLPVKRTLTRLHARRARKPPPKPPRRSLA
jgi:hypothetical protein